jgi:fluoride exporter
LTLYPGAPVVTSILWANFAGSLVMGLLREDCQLFRSDAGPLSEESYEQWRDQETKHKKSISLYVGLTAGYCGCLTSFSSFMRDIFLSISNDLRPVAADPIAPNGGYNFKAMLAVIICETGLSLAALMLGAHLAVFMDKWMPTISQQFLRRYLDPMVVLLAPLVWLATIFLVVWLPHYRLESGWNLDVWRGSSLFALVISPVGCLARFYLSLHFNARIPSFPLGTFFANVAGTAVLGIVFSVQHAPFLTSSSSPNGQAFLACEVLQGIIDGFCGCMTTVSTWVLELSALKRTWAYIYGSISIVVSVACLVISMGSLKWSKGFGVPVCCATETC